MACAPARQALEHRLAILTNACGRCYVGASPNCPVDDEFIGRLAVPHRDPALAAARLSAYSPIRVRTNRAGLPDK
jgi:hypothetical protein